MNNIENKDGGPAFPIAMSCETENYPGMTLRDWFAGIAMQGLLAHYGDVASIADDYGKTDLYFAAYNHADYMIAERSVEEGK